MAKYLLIDFNALFHRSRNALLRTGRSFSAPDGTPTTGIFSSISTVLSLGKEFKDHEVIVATEGQGSLEYRRSEGSESYKGSRTSHSTDFYTELNITLDLLSKLFPVIKVPGLEGDDSIANLAALIGEDDEAIIYSCDRDLLPLVSDRVRVLLFTTQKKRKMWDLPSIREEYGGFQGEALYFLKMMTGDASDEIPGIKGLGLKTAIKVLKEVGVERFKKGEYHHLKLKGNEEMLSANLTQVMPIYLDNFEFPQRVKQQIDEFNEGLSKLGIKKVEY